MLDAEGIADAGGVAALVGIVLAAGRRRGATGCCPRRSRARVSVEAARTFGWHRWVGDGGKAIGLDHFGASAPAETLFERIRPHAPSGSPKPSARFLIKEHR